MRKIALFFLVSFLFVEMSTAQELPPLDSVFLLEKKFAIGFSTGVCGLVVRDRVISNYLYKGVIAPLGFAFESKNRYVKSSFSLVFMNNPKLKTETNKGFAYKGSFGESFPSETDGLDFSTLKTKMFFVNFTHLYLLKSTQNSTIQASLGYDISFSSFKKTFLQFEYKNELSERVSSIGFVANFERKFNSEHSLEYTFAFPVLGYVSRSLYNSDSDPKTIASTKFSLFNNLIGFDSRFDYRFQVSSRFSLRAAYAFRYMQISFPEKEQWAYNQGTVGIYFHF